MPNMSKESYMFNESWFKKGQADGVDGTIKAMTSIIDGTDKGINALQNRELEKVRRVFLLWRDHIVENMNAKNQASLNVLLETKKIMDIKIPKTVY
jgi:hypothetical protein